MNIRYCQNCAAEIEKHSETEYFCPACGQYFWNNPAAAVAVVVIRDGTILVSKRGREPRKGTYDLPGGFLNYNENVYDAAKREMKEETTLDVDNFELLASYVGIYEPNSSSLDTVLWAHHVTGEPQPSDDVAELAWVDFSFLDSPDFSARYSGLRQLLQQKVQTT